jgi:hypothetical protein
MQLSIGREIVFYLGFKWLDGHLSITEPLGVKPRMLSLYVEDALRLKWWARQGSNL